MAAKAPKKHDALLVIDMINSFDFEHGPALRDATLEILGEVRALRTDFHRRKLPVIYVNDNFGRWDSDFAGLVRWASGAGRHGRKIARALRPTNTDLFVLKPRHSAFYETALPSLLQSLQVRRLVLAGIAADSCVLSSAMDAHTRGLDVWVPTNVIASISPERTERTLAYVRESLRSETAPAATAD